LVELQDTFDNSGALPVDIGCLYCCFGLCSITRKLLSVSCHQPTIIAYHYPTHN
jgi:hypothetical protein